MLWRKMRLARVGSKMPEGNTTAEKAAVRRAALVLVLLSFSLLPADIGKASEPAEKIVGTVIAYDYVKSWTPCHKNECEGSLIVRVDRPDQTRSQYVRVDFRYVPGNPPRQLVQSKRQWLFKLIRTCNLDEPISEVIHYEKNAAGQEKNVPIWRLVPGAENEKLPFGETLPTYLLKKNAFKLMGRNEAWQRGTTNSD